MCARHLACHAELVEAPLSSPKRPFDFAQGDRPAMMPLMETPQNFKTGFAVLVGRTNVGKSTLLNALVGTKIAIVTPKPQTTRDTYHGIVHRPEGQIVFVDTPGIFKTQPSQLVQNLHHKVRDALEGIEVLVQVVDPTRSIGIEDARVNDIVDHAAHPKILVLNK